MNSYEINEDTLAIIPKDDNSTLVYEKDDDFLINNTSYKIMEDSCEYFGSSIEGRKKGTTSVTGITHKVPIIVEDSQSLIFFPTTSTRDKNCAWISLNNILTYKKIKNGCKIYFKDGTKLNLKTSYGVINNQVLRASRLQMMLYERKNMKKESKKVKKTKI